MSRFFIITIDTEGDNLWNYIKGDVVKTENTLYIPRFQELCERYAFKPVYLTNYEMLNDSRYVNYIKPKADEQKCEIGIHIHAWMKAEPCYSLAMRSWTICLTCFFTYKRGMIVIHIMEFSESELSLDIKCSEE